MAIIAPAGFDLFLIDETSKSSLSMNRVLALSIEIQRIRIIIKGSRKSHLLVSSAKYLVNDQLTGPMLNIMVYRPIRK